MKEGPDHSHADEMIREFYGDSDRAVMILSATRAEEALGWALESLMREHSDVDAMLDPDGPIGTFSAKISLSFSLGLFETKTKHDLNLIRILRNGCAHADLPLRFKMPEVKTMCEHLLLPDTQFAKVPPDLKDVDAEAARDMSNPKTRFVTVCQTVLMHMILRSHWDALSTSRFARLQYSVWPTLTTSS